MIREEVEKNDEEEEKEEEDGVAVECKGEEPIVRKPS